MWMKIGYAHLLDGNEEQFVCLKLKEDELIIQKKLYSSDFADFSVHLTNKIRKVIVHRDKSGGLGISIKGGAEHGLPILVSKVFKKEQENNSDELYVGDAILEVNGESVETFDHEKVVTMLKCAGDKVELKVKFYQPAFQYLTLQKNSLPHAPFVKNENPNSISEPFDLFEKKWTTIISLALEGAYVCKKNSQTGKNTLAVVNGSQQVELFFEEFEELTGWIFCLQKLIKDRQTCLMRFLNKNLPAHDQVTDILWLSEVDLVDSNLSQKCLYLKGSNVYIGLAAPISASHWTECETSYRVYECLISVIELKHGGKWQLIFSNGSSSPRKFLIESGSDVGEFLKAWYQSNFVAIQQMKSKNLGCEYEGRSCYLSLNFDQSNVTLFDADLKMIWSYKFNQLKKCYGNGISELFLEFQRTSETPSEKYLQVICAVNLIQHLCYIKAFISARLILFDPLLLLYSH